MGNTEHRFGLAIAHPGHELRLMRWIEQARPTVFVLTSGSRSGEDRARVAASLGLLESLGARAGEMFGDRLDREVYDWIIEGNERRFSALAEELARQIVAERLSAVVTDAWQLYNVVHDLWHLVTRVAVARASEELGRAVACYDYAVVPPSLALRPQGEAMVTVNLDLAEVQRKLDTARAFPALAADVAEVLNAGGLSFVATETLHFPAPVSGLLPRPGEMPSYERFGEQRVKSGHYRKVLRWKHAAPIAASLIERLVQSEVAA